MVTAQPSLKEMTIVTTLPVPSNGFTTDPLGNVYIIRNSSFIKYSVEGKKLAEYSNLDFGSITAADASNPLCVILYYRDFNYVVFLDRFLVELRSPVSLDELGMKHAGGVCSSAKGGFWVYHAFDRKLYLFNDQLQIVSESMVLPASPNEQVWMTENEQSVYLGFRNSSILLFDQYANLRVTLPVTFREDFQVWKNQVLFLSHDQFQLYNPDTGLTNNLLDSPDPRIVQARIEGRYLYCREPSKIVIYNYTDLRE
jgi:hypothetical protein